MDGELIGAARRQVVKGGTQGILDSLRLEGSACLSVLAADDKVLKAGIALWGQPHHLDRGVPMGTMLWVRCVCWWGVGVPCDCRYRQVSWASVCMAVGMHPQGRRCKWGDRFCTDWEGDLRMRKQGKEPRVTRVRQARAGGVWGCRSVMHAYADREIMLSGAVTGIQLIRTMHAEPRLPRHWCACVVYGC